MNANEFTGSGTGLHNLTFHIACFTNMKLLAQTEQGYTINTEWHDCGHARANMSTRANRHTCMSVQIKCESAGLKQICTPQCTRKQAQIKIHKHTTHTHNHIILIPANATVLLVKRERGWKCLFQANIHSMSHSGINKPFLIGVDLEWSDDSSCRTPQ